MKTMEKLTYEKIKKALDNTYEIDVDGSQEYYQLIRNSLYQAIDNAEIQKTQEYFCRADWEAVYREIIRLLTD